MSSTTDLQSYTPFQEWLGDLVIKPMTKLNVWVYQKSGGRLMNTFPGGAPICLLETTGKKSGKLRTAALIYLERGQDIILVASKGGMSHSPAWYWNLKANANCSVQIGRNKTFMTARQATNNEKTELWPDLVRVYADYDVYQSRTERDIPVMILSPHH